MARCGGECFARHSGPLVWSANGSAPLSTGSRSKSGREHGARGMVRRNISFFKRLIRDAREKSPMEMVLDLVEI